MIRRLAGVISSPRATMSALVDQPAWAGSWLAILLVAAACGAALLTSDVGRQAIVDERVRVVEAFGGAVSDAEYARLQASPPWWMYATSGGRMLLTPLATLLVALGCWALARADGAPARFTQALAIVVHASVALAIGQLVATPLHYIRESLTSPLNLAAILPLMEDGTLPARFFGTLDLFALWWMALVAIGLSALTGRRARRYAMVFISIYVGFAAVMAGIMAARGGS